MKKDIRQLLTPSILDMHGYQVPSSEGMVKLDAMENPYTLNDELKENWLSYIEKVDINRYPEPSPASLQKRLLNDIIECDNDLKNEELDIIFGNGSDELIQLLITAIDKQAGPVMSPMPSFSMYEIFSKIIGRNFEALSMNADFSLDAEVMKKELMDKNPSLIFFSYPNNPTGNLFNLQVIEEIIEVTNAIVVIDEAYSAFSNKSFNHLINQYSNVVLLRTISKVGFAGVRFGMLVGPKAFIQEINKIRPPYNVNSLTQATVNFYLDHKSTFIKQAELIKQNRARLIEDLSTMRCITVYPSQTNFVTFKLKQHEAKQVQEKLLDAKIMIKNLHSAHKLLTNCLRVTVGTSEENKAFIDALNQILSK